MQAAVAAAALVNGGLLLPPTFPRTPEEADALAVRVVRPETSRMMRHLDAAQCSRARAKGRGRGLFRRRQDRNGGKGGRRQHSPRNASIRSYRRSRWTNPRYVVMVTLDEPKAVEGASGATAGVNAAPTVGKVISDRADARVMPGTGDTARKITLVHNCAARCTRIKTGKQ
ncbi:MAG: hypothetical protein R3D02_00665 [Hyphomicrobiales bacterium]